MLKVCPNSDAAAYNNKASHCLKSETKLRSELVGTKDAVDCEYSKVYSEETG